MFKTQHNVYESKSATLETNPLSVSSPFSISELSSEDYLC